MYLFKYLLREKITILINYNYFNKLLPWTGVAAAAPSTGGAAAAGASPGGAPSTGATGAGGAPSGVIINKSNIIIFKYNK